MKKTLLLAAALAALLAAPALAADHSVCLRIGNIDTWKVLDSKTLIVQDTLHQKFKVGLLGYCPNLDFKERLGFHSPGSTRLSCLSPGDDIVSREYGTGAQRCPVVSVVAYTPEMEKADKDAAAAKAQSDGH